MKELLLPIGYESWERGAGRVKGGKPVFTLTSALYQTVLKGAMM